MGFEIKYFYKEASEDAGVYKEEVLSKTSKIGKFDEEISLEVLAGKIMSQLARRNILIVDIEIYEYAKKKIGYKETDSGILIKNKKFSFDSGSVIESTSEEDEDLSEILENEVLLSKIKKAIGSVDSAKVNIAQRVKNTNVANANATKSSSGKRIIRRETYDPEIVSKHKVEQRGLKFTVGRSYPIFSEKSVVGGIINYLTEDDTGREVEVSCDCFVAQSSGLSFQESDPQYVGGEGQKEVDLWSNVSTENSVPDIRRK